jgi:hypothetical protein
MFEVFAVGDFRAHEVVLNSLRQPGVVTRTRKAYKLWATSKGPEWFYRLGSVLRKKRYIGREMGCAFGGWWFKSEVGNALCLRRT